LQEPGDRASVLGTSLPPPPPLAPTILREEESKPSPALPRHPHQHLVTGPLVPSRSAVLFPHLAALSARTPSLGKSALQAAAKPLLLAGLKAPELTSTATGLHSMPRISQPVVSLRPVVTNATASMSAAAVVSSTIASRPAVPAASPPRASGIGQIGSAQKSSTTAVHSSASPLSLPAAEAAGGSADSLSPPITSAAIISTIVGTVVQESLERERRRSQEKEEDERNRRNKAEPGTERELLPRVRVAPRVREIVSWEIDLKFSLPLIRIQFHSYREVPGTYLLSHLYRGKIEDPDPFKTLMDPDYRFQKTLWIPIQRGTGT